MGARFSPSVFAGNVVAVAEIAVADAASDIIPLKQTAAGLIGALLVETSVRVRVAHAPSIMYLCCCVLMGLLVCVLLCCVIAPRQTGASASSASARMLAKLVATLLALMKDTNAEVRKSAMKAVKRFAKQVPGMAGRAIEVRPGVAT